MIEEGESFRIGDLVQVLYTSSSRFMARVGWIARVDTNPHTKNWIIVAFPWRPEDTKRRLAASTEHDENFFSPAQLRLLETAIDALAELNDGR